MAKRGRRRIFHICYGEGLELESQAKARKEGTKTEKLIAYWQLLK
jgi:hypothetical protein